MKVKHLMLISLILLMLSVGAVSADDGQNLTLENSINEVDDSNYEKLEQSSDLKPSDEVLGDEDVINFIDVERSVIYGSGKIVVSYSSDAIGDIVLAVNGKEYKVDKIYDEWNMSNSGVATINNDLGIGTHTGIIKYMGDETTPQLSKSCNFEIVPKIFAPDTVFNKNGEVYLKLPENATGLLSIQIGKIVGEQVNWTVNQNISFNNGVASYSLGNIGVGKYTLKANYYGDDYTVEELSNNFYVNPDIYLPSKIVHGDNNVVVKIPGFSGTIEYIAPSSELNYDEIIYESQMTNGIARLYLGAVAPGKYNLWIILHSNSDEQSYEYNIDIYVQEPVLKAINVNIGYGGYYRVQITGIDKDIIKVGDKVTFKIGNKVIGTGTLNKNGYAGIKTNNLKPGSYKITAIYNTYHKLTKKVNVKHLVSLKKVNVKKSARKLVLQANVKMGKTPLAKKIVIFKFNGKTFKRITNKNGIAKLTLSKAFFNKLKVGRWVSYQASYGKDLIRFNVKVRR